MAGSPANNVAWKPGGRTNCLVASCGGTGPSAPKAIENINESNQAEKYPRRSIDSLRSLRGRTRIHVTRNLQVRMAQRRSRADFGRLFCRTPQARDSRVRATGGSVGK